MTFRRFVVVENPLLGFASCGIIVAITTLIALALIPAGRKALADIRHSITLLRPEKSGVVAAPSE